MRAGVMAALTLVGVLMGRPRSTASILAGAVLVLLALDPWLVWSIGFQLSVAATAGMVALATPLAERLRRFLPMPVALAAGTTMAAQLGVTPAAALPFPRGAGRDDRGEPRRVPRGLAGAAAGDRGLHRGARLVPRPAGSIAAVALVPMRYLETIANALAKAPVGLRHHAGRPVGARDGRGALRGRGDVARARGGVRPRVRSPPRSACFPLLVWSTALQRGHALRASPSGSSTSGRATSALVTSPSGATILIDGGPDEEQVATELAALGVKRLDVVVASHPHADHIVGLPDVLARIPVGLVLEPGCPDASSIHADLERAIADEGLDGAEPAGGCHLHRGRSAHGRALAPGLLDRHRLGHEQRRPRPDAHARRRLRAVRHRARGAGAAGAARRRASTCRPTS